MTQLADYQHRAKEFLLDTPRAGLFMGMGLGKTLTTLQAIDEGLILGLFRAVLVVAPLRVCVLTWPDEIRKHGFHLTVASLREPAGWKALAEGSAQVYLINYEALPKLVELYLSRVRHPAFDAVVFDELTRAKNHSSKRINALRRHLKHVPTRWGLTGTPAPNSYLELFAQIRLLDNGARLGESFEKFKRKYFQATDYMEYDWQLRPGAKEEIQAKIADLTLTMRTSDYLDLPDIVQEDVEVSLPPEATKLYQEAEKELLLRLQEDTVEIANAAVLSGKLLQIVSGAVYDADRTIHPLHVEKVRKLASLRKRGPLLVACNFIHERERIVSEYPDAVDFGQAKTDAQQQALAAKWNAGQIPILVADPRSIGHGLNLQFGGHHVVWFSPQHSRELYDQMNGRLFRRGQENPVTVVRIVAPNTIDEAVVECLRERGDAQAGLLKSLRLLQEMRKPPAP